MTRSDRPASSREDEIELVLRRRAAALAGEAAGESDPDFVELATLRLGRERYGIELQYLHEIRVTGPPAPVPGAPPPWSGVVAVRGELFPVLDLARWLGLPGAAGPDAGVVVLVSAGGVSAGLLVDDVPQLIRVPCDAVEPPSAETTDRRRVSGITPDLVSILDLQAALDDFRPVPPDDRRSTGGRE